MAADGNHLLEYDRAVHDVLDRLERLQSLSEAVGASHREAENALETIGQIAESLGTLTAQSAATEQAIRAWQGKAGEELRQAMAQEVATLEAAVERAEERLRQDREQNTGRMVEAIDRVQRDVTATLQTTRSAILELRAVCEQGARISTELRESLDELQRHVNSATTATQGGLATVTAAGERTHGEMAALRGSIRRLQLALGLLGGILTIGLALVLWRSWS